LVASRYHSLVAALSMGTPVSVIGWSHKYDELMQSVQLSEYIVDPVRKGEFDNTLKVIQNAYRNRIDISEKIKKNVPEIEKKISEIFILITQILDSLNK
jgi:polysaccharide pyruvyl transferase WcaK-like protein